MSKNLASVIFERAVQLWTPEHRCYGVEKKIHDYGLIQYCAVGVLKQARKDVGVSGKLYPINKLTKMLGFTVNELMDKNDYGRSNRMCIELAAMFAKEAPPHTPSAARTLLRRKTQDEIYEKMKQAAKGEVVC